MRLKAPQGTKSKKPTKSMGKIKKVPPQATMSKLEAILWKIFSEFIRLRDSDENGVGICITCGKADHWRNMDAGHFISRRYKAIKYNEQNVHIQDKSCNIFNQGNQYIYGIKIDEKYGTGTAQKLYGMSRLPCKRIRQDLLNMIDYYKAKVQELRKTKNEV